jgi:hypothetical protein
MTLASIFSTAPAAISSRSPTRSVHSAVVKPPVWWAATWVLTLGLSACAIEEAHASPDRSSCKMLSARVLDRLSHDRSLEPPVLLNVRARDHIVYLYGTVSTESQRELAADVTAATQGVEKVENMMTLAG